MSKKFRRHNSTEDRHLRGLLELAPDAMVVVDQAGVIVLANSQAETLFGYRQEELLGNHVEVLIPKRFCERHRGHRINFFSQARVRPMGAELQLFALRKNGTEFPVEISLSPVETPEGMVVDLAAIVESSEDAIISKTLDGVIASWNKGAQQIFGYTEAEAVGKPMTILFPPELREEENKILERLRTGEHIEHYETVRVTKAGSRIDVSLSVSPVKDSSGRIVGFCKIARDITERKLAEQRLRESEERLRLAQRAAGIGSFEWDIQTGAESWTPELEAVYGLPPGGFGGTHSGWINLIHEDDLAEVQRLTDETLKTGRPMTGEWRVVWPDGSVHWIAGRWQVSMDQYGKPWRVLGVNIDVTERKRAEQELSEANERLRLALEAGSAGGWDYDLKTGKNAWFGTAHEQLGMTTDETVGSRKEFWDRIHEDDRERVEHALQVAKEKREVYAQDVRVVWRDGTTHWLRSRGRFQYDANGEAERSIGISLDITERKMAEEKLREYERAVEGSEEMIAVVDRRYRYLIANNQFLKMRNTTSEHVVGRFACEVDKGFFETVSKPKLDECLQGRVVRYETKYSYPETGERDLFISYFPIEGDNGIDRVACIMHDITDRKRAEDALVELNRSLEAQTALLQSSEELLKIFVKNVPAAVAMLDHELRYLQVSDRWCSDNAVEAQELLGQPREAYPEMPERWKEVNRRALEGETLRADEDSWESAGSTRWARWEVRPWRKPDGTVGGILVFAEDITRRKQMERELLGMSRKLIESQEQERTRIGRELHDDINQRLAMLALELEQLKENPSEIESRVEELRKRTTEISNDVQALSHDLHSSKLEYLGVIQGMKSWCKEFAERREMHINFSSDVKRVFPLDIGLPLFRVLQEALHNALKHSDVKRIEVEVREEFDEIYLTVTDQGRGFDVEAAMRGKGLGLMSMQERVRLLKGNIEIQSKLMRGTTIRVRVPLEPKHATERRAV